ncbi:hypothetical protein NQ315_000362 [Exocentrus adspersus]|uniref:DNA/RNA-binding protein Alba-like domain-containing protein n=1 Tax=Exocentrus adspersus TaxID=1586481 RepID=A0AAV8VMM6_9CUCU|nr:hypothetical protein NQ315_000362 [Exocentrus adspersus]
MADSGDKKQISSISSENTKKAKRNPGTSHNFRKRPPQKPERGENVIYISTKTNIKAQLERCRKLINNNQNEIIIYCLGAAIQRGILLALQLSERYVAYDIHTNTLSTELIGELKMFFTIDELVRWLGLTVFEIWINLISILLFTVLLALNYDPNIELYDNDWWMIFFPLFAGDALNTYFCIIIFIRMLLEMTLKFSLMRISWSAIFLLMTFLFKFLLCKRLLGQVKLDYSEVFAPLYILLQLIAVRACQQS